MVISTSESGVHPRDLSSLATRLESLGVGALFVTAEPDLEPITALSGIAKACDLVLGAVIPLASSRLPTIVAKRATTLALLALDRVALVFRDDGEPTQVELLEAVTTASMMGGNGPLDFVGATIRLVGAYNEPRPESHLRLGVGAWTSSPSLVLRDACDLLICDDPEPLEADEGDFVVVARHPIALDGGTASTWNGATLVEIPGGDIDHIAAIAAQAVERVAAEH